MEQQFSPPDTTIWVDGMVSETIDQHDNKIYQKTYFSTPTVNWNTIKQLPSKKASGLDSINNYALKRKRKKLIIHFCKIINAATRLEYFPKRWKEVDIIMLPKPLKYLKNTVQLPVNITFEYHGEYI